MKKENQDIPERQNSIEVIELDDNALDGAAGGDGGGGENNAIACDILNNVINVFCGCKND